MVGFSTMSGDDDQHHRIIEACRAQDALAIGKAAGVTPSLATIEAHALGGRLEDEHADAEGHGVAGKANQDPQLEKPTQNQHMIKPKASVSIDIGAKNLLPNSPAARIACSVPGMFPARSASVASRISVKPPPTHRVAERRAAI